MDNLHAYNDKNLTTNWLEINLNQNFNTLAEMANFVDTSGF